MDQFDVPYIVEGTSEETITEIKWDLVRKGRLTCCERYLPIGSIEPVCVFFANHPEPCDINQCPKLNPTVRKQKMEAYSKDKDNNEGGIIFEVGGTCS
jgi:hypothetical protein